MPAAATPPGTPFLPVQPDSRAGRRPRAFDVAVRVVADVPRLPASVPSVSSSRQGAPAGLLCARSRRSPAPAPRSPRAGLRTCSGFQPLLKNGDRNAAFAQTCKRCALPGRGTTKSSTIATAIARNARRKRARRDAARSLNETANRLVDRKLAAGAAREQRIDRYDFVVQSVPARVRRR